MKIIGTETNEINFDSIAKGEVFRYGGEVYLKTEIIYDAEEQVLSAIHLSSGEAVNFGAFEQIEVLPNARLILY